MIERVKRYFLEIRDFSNPIELNIPKNYQIVLENLLSIVRRVMKSARDVGVSGRLAEVKIRYTGFETHTHGRSIPVTMDDDEVFVSLAEKLFANNVQTNKKIRLIGFRLGHLDTPKTKQTRQRRKSLKILHLSFIHSFFSNFGSV